MYDALEDRSNQEYQDNMLQWLAAISTRFKLGETPHQMLRRRWWDLLACSVLMRKEAVESPTDLPVPTEDW